MVGQSRMCVVIVNHPHRALTILDLDVCSSSFAQCESRIAISNRGLSTHSRSWSGTWCLNVRKWIEIRPSWPRPDVTLSHDPRVDDLRGSASRGAPAARSAVRRSIRPIRRWRSCATGWLWEARRFRLHGRKRPIPGWDRLGSTRGVPRTRSPPAIKSGLDRPTDSGSRESRARRGPNRGDS